MIDTQQIPLTWSPSSQSVPVIHPSTLVVGDHQPTRAVVCSLNSIGRDLPIFDRDRFDLDDCFKSILYLIPLLIILIPGSIDLYKHFNLLRRSQRPSSHPITNTNIITPPAKRLRSHSKYLIKLTLTTALILTQIAITLPSILSLGTPDTATHSPPVWWQSIPILTNLSILFGFVFLLILHHYAHLTSLRSSTSICFYYLSFLLVSILQLRSQINHPTLFQNRLINHLLKPHLPSQLIPLTTHTPTHYLSFQLILFCLRTLFVSIVFAVECTGPLQKRQPTKASGGAYQPVRPSDHTLGTESALITTEEGDDAEDEREECPIIYANIFSRLTFEWMTPLMKLGKQQYLTQLDIWKLPSSEQAQSLTSRLHHHWSHPNPGSKPSPLSVFYQRPGSDDDTIVEPSLIWAVLKAYGLPYLIAGIFKLLQDILQFLQPQLLKRLLEFVDAATSDSPEPAYHGYIIALMMLSFALVQTFLLHQYFQRVFVTGIRVRSGLIGLIYKKSLVLSNEEKAGKATGDIVNLMSTDVSRIQDAFSNGMILISGIFQLILAFLSLYNLLGWSMFGGLGAVLLSVPLNILLARSVTKLQKAQMKNKDQRTRLMNEILNNIRSIKLYCWENAFTRRLLAIRNGKELVLLKKMGYLISLSVSLWGFVPFLIAFSAFAIYSITSPTPLTPALVFPALSLFQLLQFPLAVLPMVINQWVEAYVSIKRISTFLTSKELQSDSIKRLRGPPSSENITGEEVELVKVEDGEFTWSLKNPPTLSNIGLSVKKSDLVAIVGRVGSGKSSLLAGILGEMHKLSGQVTIRGKVAYSAQTPWLLSATVKENILFGSQFDEQLYKKVIEGCALVDDLAMLQDGDQTQVGEKGISLSGGQKARISLARSVYARADVYLLDDPLSAVDAHVAQHLFEKIIGPNGLLKSKARILCTNAIGFVESADELIMLREGKIIERGSFSEVCKKDGELKKLIEEFGRKTSSDKKETEQDEMDSLATAVGGHPTKSGSSSSSELSKSKRKQSEGFMKRPSSIFEQDPQAGSRRQTLGNRNPNGFGRAKTESKATGSVKTTVYKEYLKSNGMLGTSIYLSTLILQQVISLLTTLWLKAWSTSDYDQNHPERGGHGLSFYLLIYGGLGLLGSFVNLANGFVMFSLCVARSAKILHDKMFQRVLRAPMSFFDVTPVGTILNRFSRDIFVIDEVMARVCSGFLRTTAGVLSVMLIVGYTVPPFFLVCCPLLLIYKRIQSFYLATSRELKRIDSTTKSPIFAMFGETLNGVATIRAFGEQMRFIGENELRVDRNQEAYYASIGSNRWLAVRLELIGNLMIFSAAALSVYNSTLAHPKLDSGLVGVLMSYALSITQSLNWLVRSATEVETNIVSCERVIEYTELQQEGPFEKPIEDSEVPSDWPQTGQVSFENVECKYREGLEPVLRGLSFETIPGEKVGICGRTGAGKSTITLSLFRLIELTKGHIKIDGIDISKIGLNKLRSQISIIPQDPQCFEGSLRDNLDPQGLRSDDELWNVLEHSRLKSHIQSLGAGLDSRIEEGGANLSNGQRQLLCLSRAMLKKSIKLIVMDEATSSIDPQTDHDIQLVIREEFKGCSILVIAHRLNTILDCDRVLVLGDGKLIEFDKPHSLIERKESSRFYEMCQQAGLVK